MPQNPHLIATFGENCKIMIYNLQKKIKMLRNGELDFKNTKKPCFTIGKHQKEGYALNWSTIKEGYLASYYI
jgi:hypothetical protein